MTSLKKKPLGILLLTIASLTLCNACASFSQAESESEVVEVSQLPPISEVVAFGRLTPRGEIISLSVSNAEDSRVNKITVEEGDWVEAGQVIAVLQGIERKERDLEEAERRVELQQAKLQKIKSGDAKEAEIDAQQAQIDRLKAQLRYETIEKQAALTSVEAELNQAKLSYGRKQSLLNDGAISQEESDRAGEQFAIAKALLNQRQAELNNTIRTLEKEIAQEEKNLAKLKEVRPIDIEIAETELNIARVAVAQRKADLEDTKVKVPVAGRILRINTRVGEKVDIEKGIIELGQTDEMYAVAEIYETEITKIKSGQKAIIESEYGGFKGKVTGEVERIGLQVGKRTLTGNSADPTLDENARVVEVNIRINEEDNNKVADLTNMQVVVSIDTAGIQQSENSPPKKPLASDIEDKTSNNPSDFNQQATALLTWRNIQPTNLFYLSLSLFSIASSICLLKTQQKNNLVPKYNTNKVHYPKQKHPTLSQIVDREAQLKQAKIDYLFNECDRDSKM